MVLDFTPIYWLVFDTNPIFREHFNVTAKKNQSILETRGQSRQEIAHLDYADHDMLHCAMVAILATNPESDV